MTLPWKRPVILLIPYEIMEEAKIHLHIKRRLFIDLILKLDLE